MELDGTTITDRLNKILRLLDIVRPINDDTDKQALQKARSELLSLIRAEKERKADKKS